VRLILEHLDRSGWGHFLDREVPDFMEWVRNVVLTTPTPQGPGNDALLSAMDLSGKAIQEAVNKHVGAHIVVPNDDTLAVVTGLLSQHTPPAQHEDGKAIDRPSVIVGCWLSALKSRTGTVEALAEAVDSPELDQLLPYALELSVIVDRWQTV
jgi:hypothetical protein